MTTTTHTPGHWAYEHATKTIRARPSNYWLASMDSFDGAVCHEANARLIAAAPDLLAALEDLATSISFHADKCMIFEPDNEHLVSARAAIAKAKGE